VAYWTIDAQAIALGRPRPVLEDGPEVADSETSSEGHGEEIMNMYAPGCESLDQSRIRGAISGSVITGRAGGQVTALVAGRYEA
jgi:hypothetical protein